MGCFYLLFLPDHLSSPFCNDFLEVVSLFYKPVDIYLNNEPYQQ